jgi:hypothetical protein
MMARALTLAIPLTAAEVVATLAREPVAAAPAEVAAEVAEVEVLECLGAQVRSRLVLAVLLTRRSTTPRWSCCSVMRSSL